MLQLSAALINIPVMSLRTSGPVALTLEPILNPNNLKMEGWYCQDNFSKSKLILLTKDIRDIVAQGIVIDDHGVLSEPEELVRLEEILKLNFGLLGKPVTTAGGGKLGKVNDYAVDTLSYTVQKIYVGQSLIKSLSGGNLSVDRSQIVEITPRRIVVQDLIQPTTQRVPAAVPLNPA